MAKTNEDYAAPKWKDKPKSDKRVYGPPAPKVYGPPKPPVQGPQRPERQERSLTTSAQTLPVWDIKAEPTALNQTPSGTDWNRPVWTRTQQPLLTQEQMAMRGRSAGVTSFAPLNLPAGEGYHWEGNKRVKNTTGLTMNPLNYRPRWSNGLAPAGEAGRPFQPSVTGFNFTPSNTGGGSGGGYGSGYGSGGGSGGGGGGGGYSYPTNPARVPTWLMNLYNWNFKG